MKSVEFRISLPLSLEQYEKGQNYTFMRQSELDQVQVLQDFTDAQNVQYTHKIYSVENKLPSVLWAILKPILGKWNFLLKRLECKQTALKTKMSTICSKNASKINRSKYLSKNELCFKERVNLS